MPIKFTLLHIYRTIQQKKMCNGRDIFILILRLNFILKLQNGNYKGSYHVFGQE